MIIKAMDEHLIILCCILLCVSTCCCSKEKSLYIDYDSNEIISKESGKEKKGISSNQKHFCGSESASVETMENDNNNSAKNTTIEVSDCGYQEIISSKKSDNHDATPTQYSYAVSIQRKGAHYATGALVGERWVLTSATEFHNIQESLRLFRLHFGSVDCKRGGVKMAILAVYPHPSFVTRKPSFDVSLLKTANAIPLGPSVQPIPLSEVCGRILSAKFLIAYWPRIVLKEKVLPLTAKERYKHNSMRVSTQVTMSPDRCQLMMGTANTTLASSTHCLEPVMVHHSICMPDVGAPVVAEDGLWGVTSGWVSPHCPAAPGPTLFTRVSAPSVRMWLDRMLGYDGF